MGRTFSSWAEAIHRKLPKFYQGSSAIKENKQEAKTSFLHPCFTFVTFLNLLLPTFMVNNRTSRQYNGDIRKTEPTECNRNDSHNDLVPCQAIILFSMLSVDWSPKAGRGPFQNCPIVPANYCVFLGVISPSIFPLLLYRYCPLLAKKSVENIPAMMRTTSPIIRQ